MSGGGGSGGGYGGGGGGGGRPGGAIPIDDGVSCADLKFRAALQSVQPGAAEEMSEGELLAVALRPGIPPVIEVSTTDGVTVGALIQHVPELLRCLQQDYQYLAEVLSVDGGHVRVEVRAR